MIIPSHTNVIYPMISPTHTKCDLPYAQPNAYKISTKRLLYRSVSAVHRE